MVACVDGVVYTGVRGRVFGRLGKGTGKGIVRGVGWGL